MSNCISSGRRRIRQSARARIAEIAASSSWASLRCKSSTLIEPIPTPTVRPEPFTASIRRSPTPRALPESGKTYEIAFRRPRFDTDGKLLEPARLTVFHNGILIQNNEELWGGTNWLEPAPYDSHVDRGPIELQDHGHQVRFRNIWLRELPERAAPPADYLAQRPIIALSAEVLDPLTGQYSMGQKKDSKPVVISRGDGHLLFKMASRPKPLVMQAISATEFVLPHADAKFTFQRDDQGKVTGILFRVGDGEQLLKKIEP